MTNTTFGGKDVVSDEIFGFVWSKMNKSQKNFKSISDSFMKVQKNS